MALAPEILVETSGLPPVRFGVLDGRPPGMLLRLLRPRLTVILNGHRIHSVTPAGEPEDGPPWGLVLLAGAVGGIAYLLVRALK